MPNVKKLPFGAHAPGDPLTRRQRLVYETLCNHWARNGGAPTFHDLCKALGINSKNGVVFHMNALVDKGFIRRIGSPSGKPGVRSRLGHVYAPTKVELRVTAAH